MNSFSPQLNHNDSRKKTIIYSMALPEDDEKAIERRGKECAALVKTYGGSVVENITQKRARFTNATFIGRRKLEEIVEKCAQKKASLLIINSSLKPSQIYAIEKILSEKKLEKKIKIWDREDLIIAIFSQHAHSSNAKLQLELAKLEHFGPRIFGMGEDLSQQGGGIGARGLGETNTEIMKRHIASRKKRLRAQLDKMSKVRENHRKRRHRRGFKTASLIGYTNAGKSATFKALTKKKETLVQNQLFATLDTKTAKVYLPQWQRNILVSDTIGFIEDLPPQLIDSFRSTLEETIDTDLLIEVVDVSDDNFKAKQNTIQTILKTLKCEKIPRLVVYNKIDALKENNLLRNIENANAHARFNEVYISAEKKMNLNALQEKIGCWLFPSPKLPYAANRKSIEENPKSVEENRFEQTAKMNL